MPKSNVRDPDAKEIDIAPSRKFEGDDDSPVDADTGEELFEDITPRLRNMRDEPSDESDEDETSEDEQDEPRLKRKSKDEDEDVEESEADESDEEQPEETSDEEVESEDEEQFEKGSKLSKRIARERRLREEAEANFSELQARLDKIEAGQKANANDSEFQRKDADLKTKLDAVKAKLYTAIEDGDTKAQTELQDQLTDLKVDLRVNREKHEAAKQAVKDSEDSGSTIVARKAAQWKRRHPNFERSISFQNFVKGVDKEVAADGFRPDTDAYYKELDRRVKKRYPEEYKNEAPASKKAEQRQDAPRNKHPSQAFRREGGAKPKTKDGFIVRGTKVQLTKRQAQNMRNFNLDPSNPNDVREYVQNNRT